MADKLPPLEEMFTELSLPAGDNYIERLEESHEEYLLRAASEGLRLVFPQDNQLQLDIDTPDQWLHFTLAFGILNRELGTEYGHFFDMQESKSKSGNRHITLTFPFKLDKWQRIAWQGALGSDRFRELYSCIRAIRNHPHPTLLAVPLPKV